MKHVPFCERNGRVVNNCQANSKFDEWEAKVARFSNDCLTLVFPLCSLVFDTRPDGLTPQDGQQDGDPQQGGAPQDGTQGEGQGPGDTHPFLQTTPPTCATGGAEGQAGGAEGQQGGQPPEGGQGGQQGGQTPEGGQGGQQGGQPSAQGGQTGDGQQGGQPPQGGGRHLRSCF